MSLVTRVEGGLNGVDGLLSSAVFLRLSVFGGWGLLGGLASVVLFVGVVDLVEVEATVALARRAE